MVEEPCVLCCLPAVPRGAWDSRSWGSRGAVPGTVPRGSSARQAVASEGRLCRGVRQYLEEACQGSLAWGEPRLKESSFN